MKKSMKKYQKLFCICFMMCFIISTISVSFANSVDESNIDHETLYTQYLEAAKEISAETGVTLTVIPMAEFEEDDWTSLEDFKKYLKYRAGLKFEPLIYTTDHVSVNSNESATKTVTSADGTVAIDITGDFRTEYIDFYDRELFIGIDDPISYLTNNSTDKWTQLGYEILLLDGRRTYYILVGGEYKAGGVATEHRISTYFYLKEDGTIY